MLDALLAPAKFSGLAAIHGHERTSCRSFPVFPQARSYARQRKKIEVERPPMLQRPKNLASIELRAVDMIRIPAKFGNQLSRDSASIYKTIPPLSPSASFIHQKFSRIPSITLLVSGIHNVDWDDCLARVSAGTGQAILAATPPRYFAVCCDLPDRIVPLWNTNLFRRH